MDEPQQKPPRRPPYELIVTVAKIVTLVGLYLLGMERRRKRRPGDRW